MRVSCGVPQRARLAALLAAGAVALALAHLGAAHPALAAQDHSVFPSGTGLVTVDAVVLDRRGQPVRGLSAADFRIEEDGAAQVVTRFEAVSARAPAPPGPTADAGPVEVVSGNLAPPTFAPRSFAIVFDDLHVTPLREAAARAAVASFLRDGVRAGDRVALVAAGSGAWWSAELPEGREDLLAFLAAQAGRSSGASEDLTDSEAQRLVEHEDAGVREWVVDRWIRQGRCQDLCEFVRPCDPREGRRACAELVQSEALRRHGDARGRLSRALATLARAMDGLAAERGRKSVVLVSEGFTFDPALPVYREVVQASLRANAAIHFVDVRGLVATSALADVGQRGDFAGGARSLSDEAALAAAGAEQIAEDSGGFAIRNGNDVAAGLERVGREAESYYLLGYEPALGPSRPGFRRVSVRVAREGVTVRARRGYYADATGRPEEPGPARPAPAQPERDTRRAKESARHEPLAPALVPRQDLRVRATAYVGPAADKSRTKVRLVAEVDARSLAGPATGRRGVAIEVRGDVWPRDGDVWVGLDRRLDVEAGPAGGAPAWHSLTWDVALVPGVYQARLVLRESGTGREGSLTHRFEVGEPRRFRFATPIVGDTLQRDAGGAPSLAANASRSFETGAGRSLYVQLELLGAKGGVEARVLVRDAAGQDVRSVPWARVAPDPSGRLVRALGFSLDDVAPGRYALRLEARDAKTGENVAHEEAIELGATAR